MSKQHILISGGTGLVGSRMVQLLKDRFDITILTRNKSMEKDGIRYLSWNMLENSHLDVDIVINLAGAGIADKRWTDSRKKELIDSRVKTNEQLAAYFRKKNIVPELFIGASAVGFYGNRGDEILTEKSIAGSGFLAECSVLWEESSMLFDKIAERMAIVRIGIVLSTKDGALPKMLMTKMLKTYNYFGDGSQYYSWIHIDDLCRIFEFIINNDNLSGILNAVAPEPITNKDMTKNIGKAISGTAIILPAPALALRLALGEMSDVVLNSTRVYPENLLKQGFNFQYTDPGVAVKDLIKREI